MFKLLMSTSEQKPKLVKQWNKHCHYVDTFDQFVQDFDYPYKIISLTRKVLISSV